MIRPKTIIHQEYLDSLFKQTLQNWIKLFPRSCLIRFYTIQNVCKTWDKNWGYCTITNKLSSLVFAQPSGGIDNGSKDYFPHIQHNITLIIDGAVQLKSYLELCRRLVHINGQEFEGSLIFNSDPLLNRLPILRLRSHWARLTSLKFCLQNKKKRKK